MHPDITKLLYEHAGLEHWRVNEIAREVRKVINTPLSDLEIGILWKEYSEMMCAGWMGHNEESIENLCDKIICQYYGRRLND